MQPFRDTFEGYVYSEWYSKTVNAKYRRCLNARFICLQSVRKLKVRGEQHIMRSVPFLSIIPFFFFLLCENRVTCILDQIGLLFF